MPQTSITKYTKHYYIGTERISSAIGTMKNLGLLCENNWPGSQDIIDEMGTKTIDAGNVLTADYDTFEKELQLSEPFIYETYLPCEGRYHEPINYDAYWYHPDHLGSSSYITNLAGEVSQHMEYLPFGETLVEEHLNSYNSPYKFNAKEYDAETGWYYYGARYYNPKWNLMLSVDPAYELYPEVSPYIYTLNNPVRYTDPTGMTAEDPIYGTNFWGNLKYLGDDGKNNGRVYFVNGKTKRDVKQATENGEFYSGSLDSSDEVSSVPSQMAFAVDESLQATKSSKRENGGHKVFSDQSTVQWDEGPEVEQLNVENGIMTRGSVTPFVVDGQKMDVDLNNLDVYYHIHPNTKGLGSSSPSNYSININGRTMRRGDVPYQAGLQRGGYSGNPFVIGAGDNRVRFYNGSGTIMKVKYQQFRTALLSEFFSNIRF